MSTNYRGYVTACQAVALFVLCAAFGVDLRSASWIAIVWTGGTALLGYAAGNGWMGSRVRDFVLRLLGHEPADAHEHEIDPEQWADDGRGLLVEHCPHGGFIVNDRCILDATHPAVTCVGCGEIVLPSRTHWEAHQEARKCAVTREVQASEMASTISRHKEA